jgi:ligand-binding sensor domain-containing protein
LLLLSSCIGGSADCSWSTTAFAWSDDNANGTWDPGESPLDGIHIKVNDTVNGYQNVNRRAVTNWEGATQVVVWLPGCPTARFEITAVTPTGYRLTTAGVVAIQGNGYGDETPLFFGFARLPNFPAPTPYVIGFECVTEARKTYDLEVAPDGTLWSVTNEGLASYQTATQTWRTYPLSITMSFYGSTDLQIGQDDTIWLSTSDGTARLQYGSWMIFPDRNSLIGSSVASVGTGADGRVWFIAPYAPTNLIAFDPTTGVWEAWINDAENHVDTVRVFTDGSVWRAAFQRDASFSPPSPAPTGWMFYDQHVFSEHELRLLPLDVRSIDTVALDSANRLWTMHQLGVSSLDLATGKWRSYHRTTPEAVRNEPRHDIAVGEDGAVWVAIGSSHPHVFRFEPAIERWRSYDPRDGLPNSRSIARVVIDGVGNIWFGFDYVAVLTRCTQK